MPTDQELTRLRLVETVLREIDIAPLRRLVRSESQWRQLSAGFRPDHISKNVLIMRGPQIARRPTLVQELLLAFFKSLGIDRTSLKEGLKEAADDTRLSPSSRTLFQTAATIEFHRIPRGKSTSSAIARFDYPSAASSIDTAKSEPHPVADGASDEHSQTGETSPATASHESRPPGGESEKLKEWRQAEEFVWEPPQDESGAAQEVVTLFERSLVAFVRWRLEKIHGEKWLKRGCGNFLKIWRSRAARRSALEPDSLLGYAELGEIKDIIINKANWPVFEVYFEKKQFVQQALDEVIPLRVSGMHPGERELFLTEHISAIAKMVKMAGLYHPETAAPIDQLFLQLTGNQEAAVDGSSGTEGTPIQTNLTQLEDPGLVGRGAELRSLNEFWNDPFSRIASIVGAGGVGKTALLEEFVDRRLRARPRPKELPDPEVLIYLTAKDNYLEGVTQPPRRMHFNTLRQIYRVTAETISGEDHEGSDTAELRQLVFSLAKEIRVLFALDNLESLTADEMEEVGRFLDDLPSPSKAIITTRDNRRMGNTIPLAGLPHEDARELLLRSLSEAQIEPDEEQLATLDEIIEKTEGVPLYLKHAANAITQGGCSPDEALQRLSGKSILEFLEFSYANCFERISAGAMRVAYFLALSPRPRRRNELQRVCEESGELDESLERLAQLAFVERVDENKQGIRFKLSSPQLAEFVRLKVPNALPANVVALVANQVGTPTLSSPKNVEIEVRRIVKAANSAWQISWENGIAKLEQARRDWNDHPMILARLGYFYFRNRRRRRARDLNEQSIKKGYEQPESY
ncbi:MAG: ATP-binding protein, partial [Chloroflexi bacterium]|nr:ATP-binding protein [Chloroflexota bacterium]